jgi:membrane-associated protease RseP (regulator of RpoE activity)
VELVQIGQPALPYLDEAVQSGDSRLVGKAAYVRSAIQNPQLGERLVKGYTHLLQQRGVAVAPAAVPPRPVLPELAPDPAALPPQVAEPAAPAGPTLDLLETIGFKIVATQAGLVIAELRADSPASRVGFAVGDLMLTVNNKVLLGLDDAKQAFGAAKEGDVFGIEASRGAEKFKLALPIPKAGAW